MDSDLDPPQGPLTRRGISHTLWENADKVAEAATPWRSRKHVSQSGRFRWGASRADAVDAAFVAGPRAPLAESEASLHESASVGGSPFAVSVNPQLATHAGSRGASVAATAHPASPRSILRRSAMLEEARKSAPSASSTASPQQGAATEAAAETDGFQLVIDALKLNGIDTIFGLPGIPITDLTRRMQANGLRVISFRHEQNAGYAASIAGFMTQKPGICLTVSAPGFLNGLTALAHATTNCFPMILISGSSEREIVDLQQGDYEEMDQLAIAKPHAKAAFRVLHAEDIGIGVARAIRAAVSGRPGGVYLDLPAKLFPQAIEAEAGRQSLIKVVDPAPRQIPAADAVKRALDLLKSAKRPLIILGKGAAYAQADADIRALVERSGIPYLSMAMAKGLLPDTHEQSASAARSYVLPEADVVMLIGARLNW